ncbi:MAG: ABC transporter ATP-binding protein [Planctomycetales bacterium]
MIIVKNLTVQAGDFRLEGASFQLPTGKYGMLMGRTGSGKTTVLEAIAGLKSIESGTIILGDRDVTGRKPAERDIGYVPQDGALFLTMSVRDHLSFALRIRKTAKDLINERVQQLAKLLEIEPLLDRRIPGLSGGEQQRVAIGRAISFRPDTLLMDEPLSALDDDTREQMYDLLKHVQQETGVTVLHVTHHQYDVENLADVVFRIEDGKLVDANGKSKQKIKRSQEKPVSS